MEESLAHQDNRNLLLLAAKNVEQTIKNQFFIDIGSVFVCKVIGFDAIQHSVAVAFFSLIYYILILIQG